MKLFFAEHNYQAEDILRNSETRDAKWVALGPSAMHCLSEKSIPYTIPEDYCSLNEIEKVCVAQFNRFTGLCFKLDTILLEKDSFLREWNVRPFLFRTWEIGSIFDTLVSRALWLRKILEKYPGAQVYVHIAPPQRWDIFGIGFGKKETLWGRLLNLPGWNNQVITIKEPGFCNQDKVNSSLLKRAKTSFAEFIKSIMAIDSYPALMDIILSFYYGFSKNGMKILFSNPATKNKQRILVIDKPYEWKYLLPCLTDSERTFSFLNSTAISPIDLEEITTDMWDTETEVLFKRFCSCIKIDGIDYTPLLKDRICWIIENSAKQAHSIIQRLEKLSSRRKFCAALNATTIYYAQYIIKQFFFKRNIPVLNWQHGAAWYDNRITQRSDFYNMVCTDTFFVYGNKVKNAYESSVFKKDCRVEPIGSIRLDRISQKKIKVKGSKCRILYVITNYYRNGWYCGFSPPFSDRTYYVAQERIIKRLQRLTVQTEKLHITVKLHPGSDVLGEDPPWIADIVDTNNIDVRRYPGFAGLLNTHDVILIDTPTTTLLEAIASSLPVFVLTSIISPPHNDMSVLQKRAVCIPDSDKLIDVLEKYIRTGYYPADVKNREFLKLYGTHLDDGKSHIRAKEAVAKIYKIK